MTSAPHTIRVLMVIPFLRHVGGMEKQSLRLAGKLRERGIEVSFLTTARPWEFFGVNAAKIHETINGFRVTTIPGIYIPIMKNFPLEFLVWGVLYIFFHRRTIDILHGHQLFSSGVVVAAATHLTRIPSLVKLARSNVNGDIDDILHRPFKNIKIRLFRHITRFIAITPEMIQELIGIGVSRENILHIPNGVDTSEFAPVSPEEKIELRKKLNLPLDQPIVLWNTRLSPSKRPEYVLEAWNDVHASVPTALLVQIGQKGGGQEFQDRLNAIVKQHHLETSIRFMGTVSSAEAADYTKAADCFTFGAPSEGLSNALLEAAVTELAIAVPNNAGNREIIQQGMNGLLSDPEQTRDLAACLCELLLQSERRAELGKNARTSVLERFSLDSVAARYMILYRDLLRS